MRRLLALLLLLGCGDATRPTEHFYQNQFVVSNTSLFDTTAPCYQIASGHCYEMGGYPGSTPRHGTNTPTNLPVPTPTQVTVTYGVSNMLLIEDSLISRIPPLVRCAANGMTMDLLSDVNHNQHQICAANLAANNQSPDDVTLIIVQPLLKNPVNSMQPVVTWSQFKQTDAYRLRGFIITFAATIKTLYPNAVIGVVSRAFAHPNAWTLHPEPYSFETGFAVRWAIAEHISAVHAPMFWLAYLHNPNDPLSYYKPARGGGAPDLVHPSAIGAGVRAEAIYQGLLQWYAGAVPATIVGGATWTCGTSTCTYILFKNGIAVDTITH